MKTSQLHRIGFASGHLLCGFALGLLTYNAFFFLPGGDPNGLAVLLGSVCLLVGIVLLALVRAEASRAHTLDEKHDS